MAEQGKDKKREFEETALPYMHSLYNAALRMAKLRQEAEGLVQDTYLLAYKGFDSFQRGTNCKAWLFKILRNLFINKYRKDVRLPDTIQYEEIENFYLFNQVASNRDLYLDLSKEPNRLKELIGKEVNAALEDLPVEFKEAVILSDIEGFTYEEISQITEVPIGTVKSRLNRARGYLQKTLWDYATKRRYIKK